MNFPKILAECGADTLVFFTDGSRVDENFYYFTGLSKTAQVTGTVIITKSGPVVITNRLESEIFKCRKIVIQKRAEAELAMKKNNGKTIGVDFTSITYSRLLRFKKILNGRKIVDVSKKMESIRSVKTPREIKNIKEACSISEELIENISGLVSKSGTEKELAAEIEYAAKRAAEGVSFPPIVAAGKNSAVPHHIPGAAKLKGVLLVDFGVVFNGYSSDITRVFYAGRPDDATKNIYKTVYRAQQASIREIMAGAKVCDVHNAANKILESDLKHKLIHSIGHGLGIAIHEFPPFGENSKNVLAKDMVITVEPGYYKKGWGGIRIEDDVLVREKAVLLSTAPSSLTEI